jgi:hypothetical protein
MGEPRPAMVEDRELCPDDLIDELNGDANYGRITALVKRYRPRGGRWAAALQSGVG